MTKVKNYNILNFYQFKIKIDDCKIKLFDYVPILMKLSFSMFVRN